MVTSKLGDPSAKVHRPGQRWPALASGRLAGHLAIADTGKFLARFRDLARCAKLASHGQSIIPGYRAYFSPHIPLLASNPNSLWTEQTRLYSITKYITTYTRDRVKRRLSGRVE
jgi:hypothetical protein